MATAPLATKRLIVNADDFGRTEGVNRGVAEAHDEGIVTSASLMVAYPGAAQAAELARARPELGVGLHLAVTGGPAVLPPERIPSLVDEAGRLRAKPEDIAHADPREVLAEARAQLRRFRELMGRRPTHLDSHHHAHTLPPVLEALVTLSWETGLPVRSPGPAVRERLMHEGLPTNDHFVDAFFGDGATLDNLVDLIGRAGTGVTELMCHPAVVDEELRSSSSYAEPRARELAALVRVDARATLQACGIQLVNWSAVQ
jgi:predicted glycoside hydrolase/deacetylase ChbG (UPF0249 family)